MGNMSNVSNMSNMGNMGNMSNMSNMSNMMLSCETRLKFLISRMTSLKSRIGIIVILLLLSVLSPDALVTLAAPLQSLNTSSDT